CNLTCLPGHHGVDCAQTCSCHEDTCDPVTGACHMETNQRQGVMGAGALLILLLGLLLSLLGCCCVCRSKDPGRQDCQPRRKKSPQRLCGRFSRISMKLPRIPLRRQKLPKVVEREQGLPVSQPGGIICSHIAGARRWDFCKTEKTQRGAIGLDRG
ncbi:scavenger receptor class F member 2-like, partial [Gracilinanus agilis]|uniref:scavenger receptor class F member 2-like n=1 Tax=Gracilinanus agilis TaxID=191870 RepID=UPI001CFDF7C8